MQKELRKINQKNQITLTKEALKELKVKPGDYITLMINRGEQRVIIVPVSIQNRG